MLVDLTLRITPKMVAAAQGNEKKALVGHIGTHFDVMDKEFPLEFTRRDAIVFDVSSVMDRDICVSDVDIQAVRRSTFVAFCTGFISREPYGGKNYFSSHPQLSPGLIDLLVDRGVSIIGIDAAGIRRGKEHTAADQYCADHNVFIVENLCNLNQIIGESVINTYPMNYAEMTGLPCRVIAEV